MTYLPSHFEQHDPVEIAAFLHANPLATVVVSLEGSLWPTPMPLIYQTSESGSGRFIGHVALANDMWRADPDGEILVIVAGANAYITPNWYPSKAETHEVVPTWNYTAVHAWGKMTVHHEVKWKRMAVGLLTNIHERQNSKPWKMGDAPQSYIADQLDHIVGVEIEIERLKAKYKLSQNRSNADREGVITGLTERDSGVDSHLRDAMEAEMKQRQP